MHSSDNQQGNSEAASTTPRSAPANAAHASQGSPAQSSQGFAGGDPRTSADWNANDAVTDFLGLDQETGADSQAAPAELGDNAARGDIDPSHSWLLSIEGEGPDAPSRGGAQRDPEEAVASAEAARRNARTKRPSLARTALLVGVAGLSIGGAYFGFVRWQESQKSEPAIVATQPAPPKPAPNHKRPPRKPTPVDPAPQHADPKTPVATDPVAVTPTDTHTNDPSHDTEPVEVAITTAPTDTTTTEVAPAPEPEAPRYDSGPRWSDERVAQFLQRFLPRESSGPDESTSTASPRELAPLAFHAPQIGLDPVRSPFGGATNVVSDGRYDDLDANATASRAPRALRHNGRSHLRLATDDDLAGIWEGKTVPLDALEKSVRLLTPQVGRVRIMIHGGEIFEGRLYAVGQQQLWLDTELGRMALEARQMATIEHLTSPDGTPALGAKGSQELDGLPRVRVRTLGGVLYGRLIGRDERNVTLVTDGGARITIESSEIEPAPVGRSLIVKGTQKKSGDS